MMRLGEYASRRFPIYSEFLEFPEFPESLPLFPPSAARPFSAASDFCILPNHVETNLHSGLGIAGRLAADSGCCGSD